MPAALDGILVIDQTPVMAGPACSMLLADMGADVIKIEPPEGEASRKQGGEIAPGVAAAFVAINRNKRGMTLELKQSEGGARRLRPHRPGHERDHERDGPSGRRARQGRHSDH